VAGGFRRGPISIPFSLFPFFFGRSGLAFRGTSNRQRRSRAASVFFFSFSLFLRAGAGRSPQDWFRDWGLGYYNYPYIRISSFFSLFRLLPCLERLNWLMSAIERGQWLVSSETSFFSFLFPLPPF